jgi:hypothetical protein
MQGITKSVWFSIHEVAKGDVLKPETIVLGSEPVAELVKSNFRLIYVAFKSKVTFLC